MKVTWDNRILRLCSSLTSLPTSPSVPILPLFCLKGTSLDDILVHDSSSVELEDSSDVCYSVWVSFAEIYNEFIYDLLGEEPKNGRNRPSLRLAEDRNHNHFIKGES